MNKNAIIAALSILSILLMLYAIAQKAEADKQAMLAKAFQEQAIQHELALRRALRQSEEEMTIANKTTLDVQEAEKSLHRK